ncbi:MAG: response regulator transcription factor [Pseudomonadota bacterium]
MIQTGPSKLIVVDDHPLFREALSGSLSSRLPDCQVLSVGSFNALQALLTDHPDADLLLLDLHLPEQQGLSGLAWLRGHQPALPIIMISAHDEPSVVRRALDGGAAGFLSKSADAEAIIQAIEAVMDGGTWVPAGLAEDDRVDEDHDLAVRVGQLTPQQYRILLMLDQGLLNKQIAWELDITEATVKAHMTAIMKKLGVNNRTQAVTVFNRLRVHKPDLES